MFRGVQRPFQQAFPLQLRHQLAAAEAFSQARSHNHAAKLSKGLIQIDAEDVRAAAELCKKWKLLLTDHSRHPLFLH